MSKRTSASKPARRERGCSESSITSKATGDCVSSLGTRMPGATLYGAIVSAYQKSRQNGYPDQKWYAAMSLGDAIEHAAAAHNDELKRHPHQTRVTRAAIRAATIILKRNQSAIKDCADFDALHALIERELGSVKGIGEMYIYDCAQRIGWALGRHPRRIYLHRGTRDGAKAVGVDVHGRKAIEVKELPADLRALTASELEDLLCIYKDELRNARPGR